MATVQLRRNQQEALDAVIPALDIPSTGEIPPDGIRATIIAAPGSGKTRIAAEAARRLTPGGRVLVLVPTLDLLTRTVQEWRAAGYRGQAVAVCSLKGDSLLGKLGVRATTSAPQLALWAGRGQVVMFATYASLAAQNAVDDLVLEEGEPAPGVLERALRGVYGQRLDPFDLAVVDEAHRTSGDAEKAWAAIHDNARLPAVRRLYMTATARVWEVPSPSGAPGGSQGLEGAVEGRLVASMDNEAIYGPKVHEYGMTEAQERGTLARFVVHVLEIRDPEPPEDADPEEMRGRRLAVLQPALLKHMDETGVRSLMTFHHRTLEAMAFARALPQTAAELHAVDPVVYPKRVGAEWLSGQHSADERRAVLDRFADGLDEDGWKTDVSFLASCRVLGEGVDIRGERGVGGVVFADTRSSAVDIVQNIGRALRQEEGEGKLARIVVPVFLAPGEDPQNMIASSSYRPLVAVLQGLRSYESAIVEHLELRSRPTGSGVPEDVLASDPQRHDDETSDEADGKAAGGGEGSGSAEAGLPPLLNFSSPKDPGLIAAFVRTRILRPESDVWLTGYNAFRQWVGEHGHARMPLDATIVLGEGEEAQEYPVGQWGSEQRRAHRDGTLRPWRFELLDELGMVWSVPDARFEQKVAYFRRYYELHGTLAAPKDAVIEDFPVGQALANLRKPHGLGKDEARAAQRRGELAAIDRDWNPPWPIAWQRHWVKLRQCLDGGATLAEIHPGVRVGGDDVGAWLAEQVAAWWTLSDGQRERMAELGVQAPADAERRTAEAVGSTIVVSADASSQERNLAALRQFHGREGHGKVPRKHRETILVDDGTGHAVEQRVALGVWRSNMRTRRHTLPAELEQHLAQLGLFT
ncbi:DEAD/DEAH box helicase [Streptomyces nanshensis]|uniref:Helicase n=1 Tax=Streptomyces nanshensis TaxID=518642 RepID=A0A1E7L4I8_9ACTN|nr:DEAD/DEAH box helicase [Streptomyces nanshensis]OEV11041.1 helicase [Streptomyces nanshensis]